MQKMAQGYQMAQNAVETVQAVSQGRPAPGIVTEPIFDGKRKIMIDGNKILERKFPITFTCPFCNFHGMSSIERVKGNCTYIWCVLLAFAGIVLLFLPLLVDWCKDYRHICPHCKRSLGLTKVCCSGC